MTIKKAKQQYELIYINRIHDTLLLLDNYEFELLTNVERKGHNSRFNFYYKQINPSIGILMVYYCNPNKSGQPKAPYDRRFFDLFVTKSFSPDDALRVRSNGDETRSVIDIIAFKVENPIHIKIFEHLLREKAEDVRDIRLKYAILLEEKNRYNDVNNKVSWLINIKNTHSWRLVETENDNL
ncbi:MAG: hypothetical protein II827_01270 [Paludibacteraceae bacterium]|nr:hypothetical protein [Paludibacteraceae bacterium]